MKTINILMGVCGAILTFFFGLFVCCFLASLVGLPHAALYGTVGWLLLLGWMAKASWERVRQERLHQMHIVQESVERQAQAQRDADMVNKPLWDV